MQNNLNINVDDEGVHTFDGTIKLFGKTFNVFGTSSVNWIMLEAATRDNPSEFDYEVDINIDTVFDKHGFNQYNLNSVIEKILS